MEIYKDEFMQVLYESEYGMCITDWTQKTVDAEEEDFKAWNQELVRLFEKYQPKLMIANTLDYRFLITPDLQEWATKNIFEKFAKAGLKKKALIMSHDLFTQVAMEQFIEEYKEGNIETKYFDNVEQGKRWLINSSKLIS